MLRSPLRLLLSVAAALAFAGAASAADKVKIGFASTLSGPAGPIGIDVRDGFQLVIKLNGGKLGGLPAEVQVGDDQFKPEVGRQLAEKFVKLDESTRAKPNSDHKELYAELLTRQGDLTRRLHAADYL